MEFFHRPESNAPFLQQWTVIGGFVSFADA